MTKERKKTTVIGLVGGIASGKSLAAQVLTELGATLVDADQIAHSVLRQPLVVRKLVQEFGTSILNPGDPQAPQIDRAALAELVFGDDRQSRARLATLESVTHPLIHAEAVRQLRASKEREVPPRAVVIDAPLLVEAGWERLCDIIVFVDAPEEKRVARALERGWTQEQFQQREKSQQSVEQKRHAATHIVASEDRSQLEHQLRSIWNQL